MSASIKYNNFALGAKESFVPDAEYVAQFVNLSDLQKSNVIIPNYANPCETYQTALDGSGVPFPDDPEQENMGIWSAAVSNDLGWLNPSVRLSLRASELFSSQGITIEFDKYNNIFCNFLTIRWYRDDELLDEKDFRPESPIFAAKNNVEFYNRIDIEFKYMNMPQVRLKVASINFGYAMEFTGQDLKNAKLIQSINPISSEIGISTGDFTLWVDDLDVFFRNKEPFVVYFNEKLRAKLFIKKAKRTQEKQWTIQTEDYIGMLDGVNFYGGVYEDKDAVELLGEISAVSNVPFDIDHNINGLKVSGHIPFGTCREALMQVAFATMSVVDTSNSEVVKIYLPTDDVSQTIPLSRIMTGASFSEKEVVTAVEVSSHSYRIDYEQSGTYQANKSGTGNNIFVKFPSPSHSLEITDGDILESGANYAIINAREECVLRYWYYAHDTSIYRKNNPFVTSGTPENVVSIDDATLVSKNNIDKIIEKCYNYIVNEKDVKVKIVENSFIGHKEVKVGDRITVKTEYLGDITGTVAKQTYSLNGGILIKDSVIR